jgi:hypothetical protein
VNGWVWVWVWVRVLVWVWLCMVVLCVCVCMNEFIYVRTYVCMYIGDEVIEDTSSDKGSYEAYYRVYIYTHTQYVYTVYSYT